MKKQFRPYKIISKKFIKDINSEFNISGKTAKQQLIIAAIAIVLAVFLKFIQRLFY